MAGDWIKMRVDICDDPAVVHIADSLGISEDEVVGKLHRLWSWADKHTTDGEAPAITPRWVDKYVAASGFATAMTATHWISFTDTGVKFPNFDRHNGDSAKRRVEATLRKRLSRKICDEPVTEIERTAIPKPFQRHVFSRDGYQCVYCGLQSDETREASRKAKMSIDHIKPEKRGGSCAVENLVCACRQCNNEKNDRTPEEWGIVPTFLQEGVSYDTVAGMSHNKRDKSVTREEKRREDINTVATSAKSPQGSSLPADWSLPDDWKVWAEKERPDVDPISTSESFKDFWIAKPGKDGRKADWQATWRNWVRNQRASPGRRPPSSGDIWAGAVN